MHIYLFIIAYLVGSIPFGYVIGRWKKGIDVRERGSGKIGGTNVTRSCGPGWGKITVLLDFLKGASLAIPALFFLKENPLTIGIILLILVIGHRFSLILAFLPYGGKSNGKKISLISRFAGGSGVASFGGFFFCFTIFCGINFHYPWTYAGAVLVIAFFVTIHKIFKRMSLSSICLMMGAVCYLLGLVLLAPRFAFYAPSVAYIAGAAFFITFYNHKENLVRLYNRTEPPTSLM